MENLCNFGNFQNAYEASQSTSLGFQPTNLMGTYFTMLILIIDLRGTFV